MMDLPNEISGFYCKALRLDVGLLALSPRLVEKDGQDKTFGKSSREL